MKSLQLLMFVIMCIHPLISDAQKIKKVSGEYTYYVPSSVSLDQAKVIALDRAKIQLIADEFGTIVDQTTVSHVENINGVSDVQMLSFGEIEVKGEWIETIGDCKYDIGYENDMLYVKVRLSGKIREIVTAPIGIKSTLLKNGTEDKYESSEFRSGDEVFLSFQSPVDGFVTVYLYDGKNTVYCLLPYRNQPVASVPIKANQRYVFFSPADSDIIPSHLVDEYVLTCSDGLELNRMYIVFSQNVFAKALDEEGDSVEEPRILEWDKFQKWMSRCRRRDIKMQVEIKDIVIRK